jgi:hypothetical protein
MVSNLKEVPFEPYCQVNVSGCGVLSLGGEKCKDISEQAWECWKSDAVKDEMDEVIALAYKSQGWAWFLFR